MSLPDNIPPTEPCDTPWFRGAQKPSPLRPGPYKRFLSHLTRDGKRGWVRYANWDGLMWGRLHDTPEEAVLPEAASLPTRYPNIPWCGRLKP